MQTPSQCLPPPCESPEVSAWLTLGLMWNLSCRARWEKRPFTLSASAGLWTLNWPADSTTAVMVEVQGGIPERKMEKGLKTTLTDLTTLPGPGY